MARTATSWLVPAVLLVLVAGSAVAVTTSGLVSDGTEEHTGQTMASCPTNRLQVVSAYGAAANGTRVGTVNLVVTAAPGAARVDLENVSVQWVGPSGTYNLVAAPVRAQRADGQFTISAYEDNDSSMPVLNSHEDRFRLTFELGVGNHTDTGQPHSRFGEALEAGAQVSLKFTTRDGATSTTRLVVPQSLSENESVSL